MSPVAVAPPPPHAARQAHGVTGKTSPVNQLLTISEKTVYMNWFIQELYSKLFLVPHCTHWSFMFVHGISWHV